VPTRKQRRRRDKTFRHEYDLVVYDEEGNEVPVDTAELRAAKGKDKDKKPAPRGGGGGGGKTIREAPPPSWNRALRRGGIMGGILAVIMVAFLNGPPALAVVYGAALIPFTYWVDRIAYRSYLRRSGKS
jgi:hypothetical protein